MNIKAVVIDKFVKIKIYHKHGIKFKEIKELFLNNPWVRRTRDNKYMAINLAQRYITVVFTYNQGIADIITAYPSSNWQIRMFKRK